MALDLSKLEAAVTAAASKINTIGTFTQATQDAAVAAQKEADAAAQATVDAANQASVDAMTADLTNAGTVAPVVSTGA